MSMKDFKILSRCAAAAFLAAVLVPMTVTAQDDSQTERPARARIERPRPLADLGLTDEQRNALEAHRKARLDESRAFREEMAGIRAEMRDLLRDPEANRAKIEGLIDKRAGLMARREKAALSHRADWDKIFTPEQREKLRLLRSRAGGRAGLAGRRMMAPGDLGSGWAPRLRPDARRLARYRVLRHRMPLRWWRR